jgi:Rrf2 family transcriptional regulator, nitric oxide-sensitive transcriptional repressor
MRLTDYTDYSLRVMLFLAVHPDGLSTIQDISDAYSISKNHLMKVVQRLAELGWIDTVRGRHGGLRLNERSLRLTIGEVVRAMESDFALVGCFQNEGRVEQEGRDSRQCVIEPHCRLKHALAAARDAFLAELDRYTLGELVAPVSEELAVLLGLPPGAPASRVASVSVVPALGNDSRHR